MIFRVRKHLAAKLKRMKNEVKGIFTSIFFFRFNCVLDKCQCMICGFDFINNLKLGTHIPISANQSQIPNNKIN